MTLTQSNLIHHHHVNIKYIIYLLYIAALDLVMQSVCIALGEENNAKWKPKDPSDPGKGKEQDFWEYSKRMLLNNKLIGKIQSYKEEKIKAMNPKSISKLKTLMVS